MLVNFLPIPTESEDSTSCVSELEAEDTDQSVRDEEDTSSVVVSECTPENGTVSWVSQLPNPTEDLPPTLIDTPAVDDLDVTVDMTDLTQLLTVNSLLTYLLHTLMTLNLPLTDSYLTLLL
ncbi:hypothetical protein LDENG_00122060 [Lucifuga dentata]|nr:hypothetical protein LDENG_00122060 [Lucifuga dentata]